MDTSDAVRVAYDNGRRFEILVEPELAKESNLEGKEHDISRLLFVQEVFTDAGKGDRASPEELEDEFGTRNVMEAAKQVFDSGDMQLTTEQKAEMREEKYRKLVDMISRRAQNPRTGNPHPPQRIENALEETGINVDWDADLDERFDEAVDLLKPIIPISLDEKTVALRIPADETGKAYDKIQQVADIEEEQWRDSFFVARITLPAGVLEELRQELQEMTGGQTEMKEVD